MAIRRLFYDIETSPNVIADFACGYNKHIGHNQILEERKIICICYKWEGKPKVYHLKWDKNKCDKAMIKKFINVLNQADEIVAHNGDRFDIKWIRGRAFFHKLKGMCPSYNSIDTLKEARKQFNLNSNRLDYLSKLTGGDGKIKTDWGMWLQILLSNHKPSMDKMIRYCKVDVIELERVYNEMFVHIKTKTAVDRDYLCNCPNCGDSRTIIRGHRIRLSGTKVVNLQCQKCYKYFLMPSKLYYSEKAKMTG